MKTTSRTLRLFLAVTALGALGLGTTGCGTTDARYIDSGGTETVVSLDQINIQDWANAGDQMVQSLLTSGVLERAPRQPALMAISRIVNNTMQQVDTDYLTKQIRVALLQSGKVETTTTMGLGGVGEDPLAQGFQEEAEFMGTAPAQETPFFTLSGKLLEDRARAGKVRQTTYTFQLSLTEVASGRAVWEDQVQITKQGKKANVGW